VHSDGPPQASLGPGTAAFALFPKASLPEDWRRPVDPRQLREAAATSRCAVEDLVPETLVEVPDRPWGRAYFHWANHRFEQLPFEERSQFLRAMLVAPEEYGGSNRHLLACLVREGRPTPAFVRIFKLKSDEDAAAQ
jgi:hypothetical protein